jgi:hypothetical protein
VIEDAGTQATAHLVNTALVQQCLENHRQALLSIAQAHANGRKLEHAPTTLDRLSVKAVVGLT